MLAAAEAIRKEAVRIDVRRRFGRRFFLSRRRRRDADLLLRRACLFRESRRRRFLLDGGRGGIDLETTDSTSQDGRGRARARGVRGARREEDLRSDGGR